MPAISWVGMTRQHFQPGARGRVRMIVLHATAGRAPGDLAWLRKGGDERRPVSAHYYISKAGRISQLVRDEDIAWHAGRSRWAIDGRQVEGCNAASIGIELENLNTGRDPYPEAQYAAALALTRDLAARHRVPPSQLVRHLDIAPGRKTDPAGFPWARFVAEVYGEAPAGGLEEQLRALMLDLAYRAAGGALPAGWPLLDVARERDLGMPVAILAGRPPAGAGSSQDDRDRAVRVVGSSRMLVEVYARDLLYAPTAGPGDETPAAAQAVRLAETPPGPLRDTLLSLMFRAADPVNGFQPGWAFHRHYLAHLQRLGAPIGPSHRIVVGAGQAYVCQHFALDSLCSPVGSWQTVYRLSDLGERTPGLNLSAAATLRRAILDDLYRARAGRRYDPAALLSRHAEERDLGAPLGPPEVLAIAGTPYLFTPFALDVLACALPGFDWPLERSLPADTAVRSLRALGTTPLQAGGPPLVLGAGAGTPPPRLAWSPRPALGAPADRPIVFDLSRYAPARRPRARAAPDLVLIAAAPGPSAVDLHHDHNAARWHYYIDIAGAIYRLRDESFIAADAEGDLDGGVLADRAVVVAVEGDPAGAEPAQRQALAWLVRTLTTELSLSPDQVRALSPRLAQPHAGHAAIAQGR